MHCMGWSGSVDPDRLDSTETTSESVAADPEAREARSAGVTRPPPRQAKASCPSWRFPSADRGTAGPSVEATSSMNHSHLRPARDSVADCRLAVQALGRRVHESGGRLDKPLERVKCSSCGQRRRVPGDTVPCANANATCPRARVLMSLPRMLPAPKSEMSTSFEHFGDLLTIVLTPLDSWGHF
jgi:hypothetical protein